jgi:uncharacterized protein (UPF0264 family)
MRLLVSVRSAIEVGPALSGGADIIDAKEPGRGSLGAVSADVLAQILDRVPPERALSVALGDFTAPDQVRTAVSSLFLPRRPAPIYLKLGFAGVHSPEEVAWLISCAVRAALVHPASPRIVAVAYADALRAGVPSPHVILRLAAVASAAGILLDTHTKDGLGLLSWIDPAALSLWVIRARREGLLAALAGGLDLADLPLVGAAGPDVLGVRGAACRGGREGPVSARRVRALCRELARADSGFVQERGPPAPLRASRKA